MTTASGWYPDPTDERTMRFWNGSQWNGERTIAEPMTTASMEAVPQPVSPSGPASLVTRLPMTPTAWLILGGAAVAALGSLLPWEQDTTALGTHVTAGPTSVAGGAAMLLALLAAIVWIAWPSRVGSLSKARRIGVMAIAALLAFLVFAKINAIATASSHSASAESGLGLFGDTPSMNYGPGLGLFVYAAGVAGIWAGTVRAWRQSRVRRDTPV